MLDILAPRALPGGRIGALGATPDFCHGLLADTWVVIDEVRKAPALPDQVHRLIELRFPRQ